MGAIKIWISSFQNCCCSPTQLCLTFCDLMDCSMPGFPSFTLSRSLLKLMSIESIMLSNHLILSCPLSSCLQSFPSSGFFPMSWFFTSGGQSIGASASASVLPKDIQSWFHLGLTGWISLQSRGLSRVFSSTIVWKQQSFSAQPSLWSNSHIHTWLLLKRRGKNSLFLRKHLTCCFSYP